MRDPNHLKVNSENINTYQHPSLPLILYENPGGCCLSKRSDHSTKTWSSNDTMTCKFPVKLKVPREHEKLIEYAQLPQKLKNT